MFSIRKNLNEDFTFEFSSPCADSFLAAGTFFHQQHVPVRSCVTSEIAQVDMVVLRILSSKQLSSWFMNIFHNHVASWIDNNLLSLLEHT